MGRNAVTDKLPTVWDAEPHTLVKHAILRRYLQAWLAILTQQASALPKAGREILFVDGFAGPGEYQGGEPGSPVIALKTAIEHSRDFPVPVRMIFVEDRPDRFEHLKSVIAPYLEKAAASNRICAVDARHGTCDAVLSEMLGFVSKP
jgi:three-Cys-motif partner protein